MKSRYEMRVIDLQTGAVMASWPPGLQAERDFVASVVADARARGVGWFTSEAASVAAFQAALEEAIYNLKASVKP